MSAFAYANSRHKKTHGKISSIPRGQFNSYFFCRAVMVILFAVRLFFLILDFSTCGYSWELARTLLIWLVFKPEPKFMDWPVPKTLDISICQTSQNAAFCNCCSSVVCVSSHADVLRLVMHSSPRTWGGTSDKPKNVCVGGYCLWQRATFSAKSA